MSWAKKIFDAAIVRTETLVRFYGILHSGRSRELSGDDLADANSVLGWPENSDVMLIGGRNKRSAILLRDPRANAEGDFLHDPTSDLLRAAHMMTVAAMDRYFHDKIVENAWKLLNAKGSPKQLSQFGIPLSVLRDALKRLRKTKAARPGSQVKIALQTQIAKLTFQSSGDIERAVQMLGGIKDMWTKIGEEIDPALDAEPLKKRVNGIVKRRNEIVHESDFVLMTRPREPNLREITRENVRNDISLIKDFIGVCDSLL